jgi:predicted outer membrane repeat protein
MARSWWQLPVRRALRTPPHRARAGKRQRPRLEVLEDRLAPSINAVVSSTQDSGTGSLRDAIAQVNNATDTSVNTIAFSSALPGNATITLDTALPPLNRNVIVQGPGAKALTVQRSSAGGTLSFGIFTVASGVSATLNGLTISGGNAADGAGIANHGDLNLVDALVTNNTATDKGGGIFSDAPAPTAGSSTLTGVFIENSAITNNTTSGTGGAAGIDIESSGLLLQDSTVSGNQSLGGSNAGGIEINGAGSASGAAGIAIQNSTIANNTATGTGRAGGLDVASGVLAGATLFDTLIAGNHSGSSSVDVRGAIIDQPSLTGSNAIGSNLIGDGTGASQLVNGQNGDQVGTTANPIDPMLDSLGDNGGPTPTMALLGGSPAIDEGTDPPSLPTGDSSLPADQRGVVRSVDVQTVGHEGKNVTDIGAFEFGLTTVATVVSVSADTGSSGQLAADTPVPFTATVQVPVTGAASTAPTGSIQFTLDGHPISGGDAALSGSGTLATASLPVTASAGTHTIGANYTPSPTGSFQDGSASFTVDFSSNTTSTIPTAITLNASLVRPDAGQAVTFTASVTENSSSLMGPVTGGSVAFLDNGVTLAQVAVDPRTGMASFITVLGAGSHNISAAYSGDSTDGPVSSGGIPITVGSSPSVTPVTGLVNVQVTLTLSPPARGKKSKITGITATLTNTSGHTLQGPLNIELKNLKKTLKLFHASGFVRSGKTKIPFLTVAVPGSSVALNATVTFTLQFSGRPNAFIPVVFAGTTPK